MNGVDALRQRVVPEMFEVVQDHIGKNALLAEALGCDLETNTDDASGDEEDMERAWDDA